MKHFRIVTATLILLTGASLKSMAQSPTIQREVRLVSPSGGTGFIGLKAASGTSTYSLTMPTAAPAANQVLTVSNISGSAVTLAWNSPDATGWSLLEIREQTKTIIWELPTHNLWLLKQTVIHG